MCVLFSLLFLAFYFVYIRWNSVLCVSLPLSERTLACPPSTCGASQLPLSPPSVPVDVRAAMHSGPYYPSDARVPFTVHVAGQRSGSLDGVGVSGGSGGAVIAATRAYTGRRVSCSSTATPTPLPWVRSLVSSARGVRGVAARSQRASPPLSASPFRFPCPRPPRCAVFPDPSALPWTTQTAPHKRAPSTT